MRLTTSFGASFRLLRSIHFLACGLESRVQGLDARFATFDVLFTMGLFEGFQGIVDGCFFVFWELVSKLAQLLFRLEHQCIGLVQDVGALFGLCVGIGIGLGICFHLCDFSFAQSA